MLQFALLFVEAIWWRRWVALLASWAVALPAWLAIASTPNLYESSTRVYLDTAGVLQPLLRGIPLQTDLEAQAQLLRQALLSRPSLMKMARKMNYDLAVRSAPQMEDLIVRLQARTTIVARPGNVYILAFRDTDPVRSRDALRTLLAVFEETNLGSAQEDLELAIDFINRQIADYAARLGAAEDRLIRLEQQSIDSIEAQRLRRDISILKDRYDELLSRRAAAGVPQAGDRREQQARYRVIDPAMVPLQPVGPDRAQLLGLAFALSLVAGLGVVTCIAVLMPRGDDIDRHGHRRRPILGLSDVPQTWVDQHLEQVAALQAGFAALTLVFGLLILLEHQYGLNTLVPPGAGIETLEKAARALAASI